MISVDSVLKKDDKYYSQMFLKEFKYIIKKKKHTHVKEEVKISFGKSDKKCEKKFDQESNNE